MDIDPINLKSPDNLNKLLSMTNHLFWWVPKEDMAAVSAEAVAEAVLSNGDDAMVRQFSDTYGVYMVADPTGRFHEIG